MFNGNNLPYDLLLTGRPKKKKKKKKNAFENNISNDIKLSKAQISKIIQSGEFIGLSLSKLAVTLIKVAVPLAKKVFTSLGITAAGIQQKIHGSGTTILIPSNKGINDILEIAQALEGSNILLKGVTKTIKNETK